MALSIQNLRFSLYNFLQFVKTIIYFSIQIGKISCDGKSKKLYSSLSRGGKFFYQSLRGVGSKIAFIFGQII